MITSAPRAPELAALLKRNQDEIKKAWAKISHDIPGSRYGAYSLDEIGAWLSSRRSHGADSLAGEMFCGPVPQPSIEDSREGKGEGKSLTSPSWQARAHGRRDDL